MIIYKAYTTLHRHWYLLIIPLLIDTASLITGLKFVELYEVPRPPFIIINEMGLPSITHILDKPLLINSFKFLTVFDEVSISIVVLVILFILFNSFGQGAYIGMMHKIVKQERIKWSNPFYLASKFSLRFFLWAFIILFLQLSVVTFLTMMLNVVGIFTSLALFLILRFVFVYFEFCIVIYNTNFIKALSISFQMFKQRNSETYVIVPMIIIVAGLFSYILHQYWSLQSIIICILLYTYIMTGLQVTLMMTLQKLMKELNPT